VKQIERWSKQLSLLDRRLFVDVAVTMHSSQFDKCGLTWGRNLSHGEFDDKEDAFGELLAVPIRNGLFRSAYPVMRSELLYTSVAPKLGKLMPRLVERSALVASSSGAQ
jgi:hypothetical protein